MREKLIELLQSAPADIMGNHGARALADHLIANGVTIPVKCKECKYWKDFNGLKNCVHLNGLDAAGAEDYCSYGLRRNDGA